MKTLFKIIAIVIITISFFNCSKNDDNDNPNPNTNPLVGQWEVTSGNEILGNDRYIYFNSNNTMNILSQTPKNFRGILNLDYAVNGDELTMFQLIEVGDITLNYAIVDNILTIYRESFSMTFQRINNGPNATIWIQELTILSEGNAPWEGNVDIAFTYDKTQIVYGMSNSSDHIGLINPTTFEEVGQIATIHNAGAVEIEKYAPNYRYLFQSDSNSDTFHAYKQDTHTLEITSNPLGEKIRGLASVDNTKIWVSSAEDKSLYLYDYGAHTTNSTIVIEIQPGGLDYQTGFLYVSDGLFLHKCQISPSFEVIKTYSIPNINIHGIAFDGTNFWVSGNNYSNGGFKLIKTNLTL